MLTFLKTRKYLNMILPVQKEEAKDSFQMTAGELLSLHLLFIRTDTVPQFSEP